MRSLEMEDEILYLNGRFMPLPEGSVGVEDRGFQLGDGIYEVIKILNRRLIWLEDHLERLTRNLGEVRMGGALDGHPLGQVLPELVARSGVTDGMVYVQVTRGAAPRDFVFPSGPHPTVLSYARSKNPPSDAEIRAGVVLHPVEDQRWARCDIKSTNLLAAVLAKEAAHEAGADEALFLSPDGVVREGGSSNAFAVFGQTVRTHPLDNRILGGITRKHAIDIARRLGYPVDEQAFTLGELLGEEGGASGSVGSGNGAAEVFVASTLKDLLPVVRIGTHMVGEGRPGPVTLALLDAMRAELAESAGLPAPPAFA